MTVAIDLSLLPAPTVVEPLDYETIFSELKAATVSLMPVDDQAEFAATLELESEPLTKLLQVAAYRELILRQRVNDSARAVMLAFASGSDLDQIGANYNVPRLTISVAQPDAMPPIAAVLESDANFRARIQLALEGITTAGSEGSYIFHGLGADADVRDIQSISPEPGVVTVYVLSRSGTGEASEDLLETVVAALNAESVRPLTDNVIVETAAIIEYAVEAELIVFPGPDPEVVRQSAEESLTGYIDSIRKIGHDVTLSGLYAALHQPGVQRVELTSPSDTVEVGDGEAAFCTAITVTAAEENDV